MCENVRPTFIAWSHVHLKLTKSRHNPLEPSHPLSNTIPRNGELHNITSHQRLNNRMSHDHYQVKAHGCSLHPYLLNEVQVLCECSHPVEPTDHTQVDIALSIHLHNTAEDNVLLSPTNMDICDRICENPTLPGF